MKKMKCLCYWEDKNKIQGTKMVLSTSADALLTDFQATMDAHAKEHESLEKLYMEKKMEDKLPLCWPKPINPKLTEYLPENPNEWFFSK